MYNVFLMQCKKTPKKLFELLNRFWTLQGWNKRVDYEPGTGSRQLFPKMHLETCGGPLSGVKAMVELQTNHIGKGCDRETYSEKSLQKLCGK